MHTKSWESSFDMKLFILQQKLSYWKYRLHDLTQTRLQIKPHALSSKLDPIFNKVIVMLWYVKFSLEVHGHLISS